MTDVNWERVARSALNPLRLRIIERAASSPTARFCPSALALEWSEPLGNVSYHVRALYEARLLTAAGTETVRGAVRHYYRAATRLVT
jgi:DNA-binding transcriptional ArsR family regulator